MSEATTHAVILGLDPLWLSTSILIITYVALLTERFHRAVIVLLGAGVMIISGVINQSQAIAGIDFNTIALLTGMMIIVSVTRQSGVFEFVAIWSAKKVKASPSGILIMLSIVTAVFSAFLDNLTTVLLVVPVALLIADKLKLSPYPFLFSQIIASNVGGTATLIGDPPNILIGSATGYSFNDFLFQLGPVSVIVLAVVLVVFHLLWGRSLETTPELKERVMSFDEQSSIQDIRLMRQSLTILGLVITGFVIGEHYQIQPGTTAMFGATLLLFIISIGQNQREQADELRKTLIDVEWNALFFFAGLFILISGVEHAGLLHILADKLMALTGGDIMAITFTTLWLSAGASAAIDNIPLVATMIPLIQSMETSLGGTAALEPVWWSLALGACLGGNGSLIGAAANVLVAGLAERSGTPISFVRFLMIGMPIMLVSVAIANVYLYFRHFA